jgi:Methyltransferase domain
MSRGRKEVLTDLIKAHKWNIGAELGVWQGNAFGYLLGAFPKLFLYGVDHWRAEGIYADKDMAASEKMVMLIAAKYSHRCIIIKNDTVLAANDIGDLSLDFVFVDASHDTESVTNDVRAWRPKVRKGGMLLGHDANLPSVKAALDAELPGWQLDDGHVWRIAA